MGGSVPFNIRELCLPLATQAIVHGTNETNGQTIDVGGIVPVEFFLNSILASLHVRKEIMRRDGVDEST